MLDAGTDTEFPEYISRYNRNILAMGIQRQGIVLTTARASLFTAGRGTKTVAIRSGTGIILPVPEWRNWQTRRSQKSVRGDPGVGSSPTSGTT